MSKEHVNGVTRGPERVAARRFYFRRWGIRLGRLHVTWFDLWTRKFCFDVDWFA